MTVRVDRCRFSWRSRRAAVQDGGGKAPELPFVLPGLGPEGQEATLAVGGQPGPEGGQADPDLPAGRVPVRLGGGLPQRGGHALALRLQGGGDEAVPERGDVEGSVLGMGHARGLRQGRGQLNAQRRGSPGEVADGPEPVELPTENGGQSWAGFQGDAPVPEQPGQVVQEQEQKPG